jgi:hypothetical protein
MMLREIIAFYCEKHTEHTNALCGQTLQFLDIKTDGANSYHYSLKDRHILCSSFANCPCL